MYYFYYINRVLIKEEIYICILIKVCRIHALVATSVCRIQLVIHGYQQVAPVTLNLEPLYCRMLQPRREFDARTDRPLAQQIQLLSLHRRQVEEATAMVDVREQQAAITDAMEASTRSIVTAVVVVPMRFNLPIALFGAVLKDANLFNSYMKLIYLFNSLVDLIYYIF